MKDAAKLLQTTLDEEQATDIALTSIATSVVTRRPSEFVRCFADHVSAKTSNPPIL